MNTFKQVIPKAAALAFFCLLNGAMPAAQATEDKAKAAQATNQPAPTSGNKPVVAKPPADVGCKDAAGQQGGTGKIGATGNGQQGAGVKGPVVPKCPGDVAGKAAKP